MVETTAWVLIYGGLLVLCLGVFALALEGPFGWALVGTGAVAAVLGILLVVVRSHMDGGGPAP